MDIAVWLFLNHNQAFHSLQRIQISGWYHHPFAIMICLAAVIDITYFFWKSVALLLILFTFCFAKNNEKIITIFA